MARNINRRNVIKGISASGFAGLTGLAGCIGGSGGSDSPDVVNIIGYPEDGIQLFKDFYETASEDQQVIVPDGLKSSDLAANVGHDLSSVLGTAPAAGGPNQEAYTQMYEDEYGSSPGVFTAQSYDSVAIQILANAAAGDNSGQAIRDQMRRMANPGGMEVGPENFVEGVEAAANGDDIDFKGASSSVNFDQAGDPASAAYDIWEFTDEGTENVDTQTFEGDNPEGAGSMADSGPGGMGRTIKVGILLPSTGALAPVGEQMINAAQIPAMQVNDSDVDLEVDTQVEDTATDSSTGVSRAETLVNAGYPSICGSASSGVNVPVCKNVLIPNNVVGCSPSSTALSVTSLDDDDFIFRTAPSDKFQGPFMGRVAADHQDASTASTLYVNNDYGEQLSNAFAETFESEHDGEVWNQVAFNQGQSSYTSKIENALSE
ncbi:branched-chain amino acid ABC transporter substrate-binding protein [Halobacteriales archaeon QS_1_68_20]|nr:MAG: branched-chain amino acid ABC transporter substrate-binding protein [Halobacteriales archaeon QS_1_68_20]